MFELALSQVALAKSKSSNEFDFFRIMTIMHKIGCGSYELKNVFLKCRETLRISRRKGRVSEKSLVYFKNKNDAYSLCSIRRVSNKI